MSYFRNAVQSLDVWAFLKGFSGKCKILSVGSIVFYKGKMDYSFETYLPIVKTKIAKI